MCTQIIVSRMALEVDGSSEPCTWPHLVGPAPSWQRLRHSNNMGACLAHGSLTKSMQAQPPDRELLHGAWAAGGSTEGTNLLCR